MSSRYSVEKVHSREWRSLRTFISGNTTILSHPTLTPQVRAFNQLDWQSQIDNGLWYFIRKDVDGTSKRIGYAGFNDDNLTCFWIKTDFRTLPAKKASIKHLQKIGNIPPIDGYSYIPDGLDTTI